jgi:hypothetical protein
MARVLADICAKQCRRGSVAQWRRTPTSRIAAGRGISSGDDMSMKSWAACAVALILPFLNGCGNDAANQGDVRMVNATTEYSSMDLYDEDSNNNNNLFIQSTASQTVSSYHGIDEGTYQFNVQGTGTSSTAASVQGAVTQGDHFTVVAYLTGTQLQAKWLTDEESSPSSGNAKLRIFNAASSEVSSVDVYLTSTDCTALGNTDAAFATGVSDLQDTYGQIIAASSGTAWNICVTATGDKSDVRLSVSAVTFKSGQISTLILTHTSGGVLLNGALLDQQGTLTAYSNAIARVRLVADASGGGTVGATVNGVPLAGELTSPTVNPYVIVPSGALTTQVTIDGTDVSAGSLSADAGSDYTLLVAGTVASPSITLLPDNNTPSTSTSFPVKIRLVNGVNGGGSATLSANGSLVGSAVAFGAASVYANVASADATAEIKVTIDGTSPYDAIDQTLAANSVYTVFILGDSTAPQGTLSTDR